MVLEYLEIIKSYYMHIFGFVNVDSSEFIKFEFDQTQNVR
jgi:hypothetical protein